MKMFLVAIGKTDEKYIEEGIIKYISRIVHYTAFEMKVLPDVKNRRSLSFEQQKKTEREQIMALLQPGDELIMLDEQGQQYNSRAFSVMLEKKINTGVRRLFFVIGGPYGFSAELYERAQGKVSLSSLTFSHQMVRLIFLEQLYRAFTIMKGEPYHHD